MAEQRARMRQLVHLDAIGCLVRMAISIQIDDLRRDKVIGLLQTHLDFAVEEPRRKVSMPSTSPL